MARRMKAVEFENNILRIDFRESDEAIKKGFEQINTSADWITKIHQSFRTIVNRDSIELTSSGTTGTPKKFQFNLDQCMISAKKTNDFFNLQEGNTSLLMMNPDFVGGKMMIIRAWERKMVLFALKPSAYGIKHIDFPIDFTAMVPYQVERSILDFPKNFSYIKNIIIGGGAVSISLQNLIQNKSVNAYSTFGMTETLSHIALKKLNQPNDYYRLLSGINIDKDDRGCLVIHYPELLKNQLVTNDIITIKQNGFEWKGRFDDIIVSGGLNINPIEDEELIRSLIDGSFILVGVPDEQFGEKVVLVKEGNELSDEILSKIKEMLPPYHAPKAYFQMDEFPRTKTGKVQRKVIRQQLIDGTINRINK